MSPPRCTVLRVRLDDLDLAMQDPALAALVADGWQILASVVLEIQKEPTLHLLMGPPSPATDLVRPVWRDAMAIALVGFLCGVSGVALGALWAAT